MKKAIEAAKEVSFAYYQSANKNLDEHGESDIRYHICLQIAGAFDRFAHELEYNTDELD